MITNRIFKRTISLAAAFLVLLMSVTLYSSRSEAANTVVTYNVRNAITGEHLRNYTLQPLAETNNSRAVIGEDNRYVDWSKSGVVKLIFSYYDYNNKLKTGIGSGFVIDSHTIATAAHCVHGAFDMNVLLFNSDGTLSMNATPVEYHLPNNYAPYQQERYLIDYALITVKEDISSYACFNLGVPLDNIININPTIKVTGFSGDDENDSYSSHTLYTSEGKILSNAYIDAVIDTDYLFAHDADTYGGNSGGPVYIEESRNNRSYNTVIAIHTSSENEPDDEPSYNASVRITTNIIHFYMNNPNLNWETEE